MDQNSQSGSSTGGPDWGTMGGTVGDGLLHGGGGGTMGAPMAASPPPQQLSQSSQAQPSTYLHSVSPQPTTIPPPGNHRFAAGQQPQSSYAARSAAAHATVPTTTTTTIVPSPVPSSSSYAVRSAQANAAQPYASPPYVPSSPAYGGQPSHNLTSSPYAQVSSHMPPPSPQPPSVQHPQSPSYNTPAFQSQPSPNRSAAAGNQTSYAERAAQAYAAQQQKQQPPHPSYPPAPTYTSPPVPSYYGNQQPQASAVPYTQPSPSTVTQYAPVTSPATPSTHSTQPVLAQSGAMARPGQSVVGPSSVVPIGGGGGGSTTAASTLRPSPAAGGLPASQSPAVQNRLLEDATRKVQEHAYYMKQAMEQQMLPTVLDRAAYMVGELGGLPHGVQSNTSTSSGISISNTGLSAQLTPKNYYELYMRALEEMPALEDYLLGLAQKQEQLPPPPGQIQIVLQASAAPPEPCFRMRELYDCVQYCPRVLPRLYLQICAGSALLRSGEVGAKWVLDDILQVVKCEQNPIRGLFLCNYLLTVLRDKVPDGPLPSPAHDHHTHEDANPEDTSQQGTGIVRATTTTTTSQSTSSIGNGSAAAVDDGINASTTTALRMDPEQEPGTVVDSYEFVLANFMEMNKLWVRLQHLPGEGRNKDVKKRRERERNELRILVGTNLVRLSQLEGVTSKIYGESILPRILEHIVIEGDPLSQAYLMDCLVQVFPDEYHIETMPILLGVCPRLRDKVNIRTILLGLMDRLANYLAEEELLDESDTNQVKLTLARDSFGMFEDCVQKVYNARGPKLTAKEVIRLQTALLQFSIKCYPGNLEQITICMSACVAALHQANASYEMTDATLVNVPPKQLDDVAVAELEKLLSIPLESLALKVLQLQHYGKLITFLPWSNQRGVAIKLLSAVDQAGSTPRSIQEIQQLFQLIQPLMRDEGTPYLPPAAAITSVAHTTSLMSNLGVSAAPDPAFETSFIEDSAAPLEQVEHEAALVSKLIHLLDHPNTDVLYEMLVVARRGVQVGGRRRMARILASLVIAGLRLTRRVADAEMKPEATVETTIEKAISTEGAEEAETQEEADSPEDVVPVEESKGETETPEDGNEIFPGEESQMTSEAEAPSEREVSCRQIFIFLQETIRNLGKANPEAGVKMYLETAIVADSIAQKRNQKLYSPVCYEMLSQAYSLYEEAISDSKIQLKCVTAMIGTLMACNGLTAADYETLITKSAQLSAKLVKKSDQCRMVALCAHLFYPASKGDSFGYRNAQRSLECLQRSLKLADSCTSSNPANVDLFVELLEHYLYLFEKKSPTISAGYITGLVALIKEHINSLSGSPGVMEAKKHFMGVIRDIKRKKAEEATSADFEAVQVENIPA